NRSRTSWAGPTSKSVPPRRSTATRRWSTVRSRSAGTPGSTNRPQPTVRPKHHHRSRLPTTPERGGPSSSPPPPHCPCWPKALRAVGAWLTPWLLLQRLWNAWSAKPPPDDLQRLLDALSQGHGLNLYIPP